MNKSPEPEELSIDRFHQWLTTRPGKTLFRSRHSTCCPLARHLADRTGKPTSVSRRCYFQDDNPKPLPPWAQRFTNILDADYGENINCLVTVNDAINALERAEMD